MSKMDYKENFEQVLENIELAKQAGPYKRDVKLVSVTKNHGPEVVQAVLDNGQHAIGENRVQELVKKMDLFEDKKDQLEYHLIGTLQRNKVKYIIDRVHLIHSLDRLSLAKEIDKRAGDHNRMMPCLVQVNISKEETKGGLYVEDLEQFIEDCLEFKNIRIKGLMTMAPETQDEKLIRKVFKECENLRQKIEKKGYNELDMDYLSMGMTNDYQIAIEEGANIIRVGRSLFGQRDYSKRYF